MDYNTFRETYGIRLNPQQDRAVRKVDGPTLLLAVPGSGKTTVMITRIGYMILCCGIAPQSILTMTFSRSAADEMRQRFCAKFGEQYNSIMRFGTIHSFCLSVLRRAERMYGVSIPELEPNPARILRKVFFDRHKTYPTEAELSQLQRFIGYYKNKGRDPFLVPETEILEPVLPGVDFDQLFRDYESTKRKQNQMDFDDQLIYAHRILKEIPALLQELRKQYPYINVDEAQDTSLIQHALIRRLAGKQPNLFMVGDEDQSIYGFRAASPGTLVQFHKIYAGAERLMIETNYRSAVGIAEAAARFIRQNQKRTDKQMVGTRPGGEIHETVLPDLLDQYRYVFDVCRRAIGGDRTLAILYRNNESALPLADLLRREGILFGGEQSVDFFAHFVVKDILSILSFVIRPCDIELFGQFYAKMGLPISKSDYAGIRFELQKRPNQEVLGLLGPFRQSAACEKLERCKQVFKRIQRRPPEEAIEEVLRMFYLEYMEWLQREHIALKESLIQKCNTLRALAHEYKTVEAYLEGLEALQKHLLNGPRAAGGVVTLSTIHSSKGQEFDKVILIDLLKDILPMRIRESDPEASPSDLYEAEVRLFYVGVTRAKDEIELLSSKRLFGEPVQMSPFIDQILGRKEQAGENHLPEPDLQNRKYRPGAEIEHRLFGKGTVLSHKGDLLVIRFEGQGEKRLLLSACLKWGYLV